MDAFSRAVRLGEGVESSNLLSEEAQDRANLRARRGVAILVGDFLDSLE